MPDPTDPLANLELQNPSYDATAVHTILRPPALEALTF